MDSSLYPAKIWLKEYGDLIGVDFTLDARGRCYIKTNSEVVLQLTASEDIDCAWIHVKLDRYDIDVKEFMLGLLSLNKDFLDKSNIGIALADDASVVLSRVLLEKDVSGDAGSNVILQVEEAALSLREALVGLVNGIEAPHVGAQMPKGIPNGMLLG